jgi:malate/lactate dehydrogenase
MKISIIWAAGNIGSCAAFNIAINKVTDELIMIDSYSADKLEQYVYDLTSAVVGLDTLVQAGTYEDLRDSDIVLISAGSANVVASRMEVLRPNLPLIQDFARKIKQYCPKAIIITATNPVCPLNYGMYLSSGFDRRRLIGYSANDSIRFRMFLAQALGVKSSKIQATVIGEHGNSQVLLFSSVKIDGKSIKVTDEVKQQVKKEVAGLPPVMEGQRIKTGRTAAWTTSMGLTAVCRAISHNTGEMIPCSLVLDGEYDVRRLGMSVPAIIGKGGVRQILEWELEPEERKGLEQSVNALEPSMRYVEEFLGLKGK